jgi:hypothetical protein
MPQSAKKGAFAGGGVACAGIARKSIRIEPIISFLIIVYHLLFVLRIIMETGYPTCVG